ncbi:MAG: peptidylprolyl isomerase [Granulosicoccaceae bacterium]|jgi:FKBP-type peptidyl-prolyl cis-trans isomerase SlyD
MQITANSVVTMNYRLTDEAGTVIDESQDGSFNYLHGASNIIPGLESELEGKQAGDELTVTVEPKDAYGERNDAMTQVVSRDMFDVDTDIQPGMQFHASTPDGQPVMVTVAKVEGDDITIDGNHPLAGVQLTFAVNIVDVRDATADEIAHGHVHADGNAEH